MPYLTVFGLEVVMEAQWLADRTTLRTLLRTHPEWSVRDFAEAVGRSRGWVKKWRRRLRAAPLDDDAVVHSRSRVRTQLPPPLDPQVIDRILAIRDDPPTTCSGHPGPKPSSSIWSATPRSTRKGSACRARPAPSGRSCGSTGGSPFLASG